MVIVVNIDSDVEQIVFKGCEVEKIVRNLFTTKIFLKNGEVKEYGNYFWNVLVF